MCKAERDSYEVIVVLDDKVVELDEDVVDDVVEVDEDVEVVDEVVDFYILSINMRHNDSESIQ